MLFVYIFLKSTEVSLVETHYIYWKEICGCILFGGGEETADYIALKQSLYIHTYF